jgi:hypothetical protein
MSAKAVYDKLRLIAFKDSDNYLAVIFPQETFSIDLPSKLSFIFNVSFRIYVASSKELEMMSKRV